MHKIMTKVIAYDEIRLQQLQCILKQSWQDWLAAARQNWEQNVSRDMAETQSIQARIRLREEVDTLMMQLVEHAALQQDTPWFHHNKPIISDELQQEFNRLEQKFDSSPVRHVMLERPEADILGAVKIIKYFRDEALSRHSFYYQHAYTLELLDDLLQKILQSQIFIQKTESGLNVHLSPDETWIISKSDLFNLLHKIKENPHKIMSEYGIDEDYVIKFLYEYLLFQFQLRAGEKPLVVEPSISKHRPDIVEIISSVTGVPDPTTEFYSMQKNWETNHALSYIALKKASHHL